MCTRMSPNSFPSLQVYRDVFYHGETPLGIKNERVTTVYLSEVARNILQYIAAVLCVRHKFISGMRLLIVQ